MLRDSSFHVEWCDTMFNQTDAPYNIILYYWDSADSEGSTTTEQSGCNYAQKYEILILYI